MFVAFSILFIVFYFVLLIWDDFYESALEGLRTNIKRVSEEDSLKRKMLAVEALKHTWTAIPQLFMLCILPIYLGVALKHDELALPTLLIIAHFVWKLLRGIWKMKNGKKLPTDIERYQAQLARLERTHIKYKGVRVVINGLYVLYFAYMIVILIF